MRIEKPGTLTPTETSACAIAGIPEKADTTASTNNIFFITTLQDLSDLMALR
jgi:hypothetical protein